MKQETIAVPGCKGTTVQEIFSDGQVQVMKVDVEPNGEIPMHSHDTPATMIVVSGSAMALGKACKYVRKGDVVVKVANEAHGFTEITEPFSFISISHGQGIMHKSGQSWDMHYL